MRLKSRTREGIHTVFTSGTALGTVLMSNYYRQDLYLYNSGSVTTYFGFSTAINSGTSLPLLASANFSIEQYTGPVYAFASSGSAILQVVEFVESTSSDIRI